VCSIHLFSQKSVIYADHSPRIASFPRHSGLLRKNMSHPSRTSSAPLRRELRRPTLKWIEHRSEYSRFVVKKANGKTGFTYSGVSQVSYFMPLSPTTMRRLSIGASRCGYSLCSRVTMYVTKRFQTRVTRLAKSLARFEADVNSRWFLRTSVILVLSDISKFRTKIHEVH
jgi:hypothetical protein